MSFQRNSFIIDASILVALFVKVPHTNACIDFVGRLSDPATRFASPDAMYFEVASSLRKLERRGLFDDVDTALTHVAAFAIDAVSSKDLMRTAAHISRGFVVSLCDAFYLALSQHDGLPLITADARLVNGVKGKGFDVRFVGEM